MMSVKRSSLLSASLRFFSKNNVAKEQLLKKLSRVSRAKEVDQKIQETKQLNIKPSELDVGYNTRIIEDMIANMKKEGKIVQGVDENEYVKLIEKMREMKKEETKRDATVDEIEKAMKDFVKEQEDMKITEGTGLKMKRPPRTVKETIETLKEADKRYEGAKTYLFGQTAENVKKAKSAAEEKEEVDPLRNVPRGMTLQRLYYPPSKSEIILVGLRRRAGVHA